MSSFIKRVLVVVLIVGVVVAAALFASSVAHVLLLVFGGIILAVLLNGLASFIQHHTPLGYGPSLTAVLLIVLLLAAGTGALLGPRLSPQLDQMSQQLPQAIQQIESKIRQYGWGRAILRQAPNPSALTPSSSAEESDGQQGGPQQDQQEEQSEQDQQQQQDSSGSDSPIAVAFSKIVGALTDIAIIVIVGLYLAANPSLYQRGLLHLVPPAYRQRAREVLDAEQQALRHWLAGRFASMTVLGILTVIGLWILGIPLALTLGLIAGVLSFVPNIGPLLSMVPAIIIALLKGPMYAVYVVALYAGVQTLESYLITPLIQQRAVSIPPALLITVQVMMGVLFGILGLFLATPLAVAVIVLIQMLYVEDVLGDEVGLMGQ